MGMESVDLILVQFLEMGTILLVAHVFLVAILWWDVWSAQAVLSVLLVEPDITSILTKAVLHVQQQCQGALLAQIPRSA